MRIQSTAATENMRHAGLTQPFYTGNAPHSVTYVFQKQNAYMKANEKIILFVLIQNIIHLYTALLTTHHSFHTTIDREVPSHIKQLSHLLASQLEGSDNAYV